MSNEEKTILRPEPPAQPKPKFKIVKEHIQGAVAMLLVVVLALSALVITPGVDLFGSTTGQRVPMNSSCSRTFKLNSPASIRDNFPQERIDNRVILFPDDLDIDIPDYCTSHIQGYARYRDSGGNYDFHAFSYSNVYGKYGYIFFASDKTKTVGKKEVPESYFYIKAPETPTQFKEMSDRSDKNTTYNPHFNHPGGIQILGDNLVMSIIPYHTANGKFYNYANIYMYDLSPLKETSFADKSGSNETSTIKNKKAIKGKIAHVSVKITAK